MSRSLSEKVATCMALWAGLSGLEGFLSGAKPGLPAVFSAPFRRTVMERRRLRFCGPSDVKRIGTFNIIIWAVDGSGHVAIFRVRRGLGAELEWGGGDR